MSGHIRSKLKTLQQLLLPQAILTQPWLDKHGINRKLSSKYVESGWLERVGVGAFKRDGEESNWQAALSAIQMQLNLPIHIGAKSALEIKGGAHYLKLSDDSELFLFSPLSVRNLPKWFRDQKWNEQITLVRTNLFSEDFKEGFTDTEWDRFKIRISSKERAIMELLYLIPKKQTWDETDLIVENLTTLRPKLIQSLLENCSSIRVKRLFLFFAEKHNHQWFQKIDLKQVDLGTGDRLLYKGGSYDKKYKITVPKHLVGKEIVNE